MPSAAQLVRRQQKNWSEGRGVPADSSGYTQTLEDNLFIPLSPTTRAEFSAGDGGELGEAGERGKMQALHSSSALSCNVFEYWRARDAAPLAHAVGIDEGIESITFERKFPTGLRGNPPNLDVCLISSSGLVIAIECKFLEPYGTHGAGFRNKYFEHEPGLWETAGFPSCQKLAEQLYSGEVKYTWLNGEQLLKHILGLHRGLHKRWALLYLWYEVPGTAGVEHGAEAEAFASVAIDDGIDFRAITYQSVFHGVKANGSERDREYLTYLGERYFGESG